MPTILAVALENHPGSLADILELLAKEKINLDAVEAEAAGDFGSVRVLLSDPEKATKVLRKKGYDVVQGDAIELRLPNRPGELARVARKLATSNVNVVSLFGTTPAGGQGEGRLLLRVNNAAAARAALGLP